MQKSIVLFKFLFFWFILEPDCEEEELCRAWAKPFAAEGGPPPGEEAAAVTALLSPAVRAFQKVSNLDQQKTQTPMPENKI